MRVIPRHQFIDQRDAQARRQGLRFRFNRVVSNPVTVEVFQVSAGRFARPGP